MKGFIDVVDINDITNSMWIGLSNRLKENISFDINNSSESSMFGYKGKMKQGIVLLHEEGEKFNGIINFIKKKTKNKIVFSASSEEMCFYGPDNVSESSNYSYFHSKDLQNSWICIDFVDNQIIPTSYEIKTYPYAANDQHPKSWVIEVSNDNSSWFIVDEINNCSYLNRRSVSHTFKIKNQTSQKFRYIRMRLTGPNWLGKNSLAIKSFEVYGTLMLYSET